MTLPTWFVDHLVDSIDAEGRELFGADWDAVHVGVAAQILADWTDIIAGEVDQDRVVRDADGLAVAIDDDRGAARRRALEARAAAEHEAVNNAPCECVRPRWSKVPDRCGCCIGRLVPGCPRPVPGDMGEPAPPKSDRGPRRTRWTPDPRAREWAQYRAERRALRAADGIAPSIAAWHARGHDVPAVEPDQTYYVTVRMAAEITGLLTGEIYALRRRGKLRSIGMTLTEYARARGAAGWEPGGSGWAPSVWFLREDLEAYARERGTT
jgi:hypothetical protein